MFTYTTDYTYLNFRYRMITYQNKCFIIDLDSSPILYIFPILIWIVTPFAYEVSLDTRNQLLEDRIKKVRIPKKQSNISILISGIALSSALLLKPMMHSFSLPISTTINTILVIVISTLLVIIRHHVSKSNYIAWKEIIDCDQKKIAIRPSSILYIIQVLCCYCLILFVSIGMLLSYINESNPIVEIIYITLFYVILSANCFIILPNKYKLKEK